MSFQIPTLADLVNRSRRSFRAYLPGTDAWLWPNVLGPTAKVIGGMVSEVFGFADHIAAQRFAGTADAENLERHAQELGLARRPASPAGGKVTVTAEGALIVAPGAQFRRADGVTYIATAGGELVGAGDLDVEVIAALDGAAGNAIAETGLEIVSGVTGDAVAEVAAGGILDGIDIEPDGDKWTTDLGTLRGRILFRKRNPPHGGAPADYVLWSTEVAGVTRVFVERDPPEVRVYPLLDDLRPNGIPTPGDLALIAAHIETQKPATAIVSLPRLRPRPIDITIAGLSPDTVTVREQVLAELRSAFRRLSAVAGVDLPHAAMPFLAVPHSFSVSWVWQAIANASGERRHRVDAPAADIALTAGEIPTLGSVTFI